MRTSERLAGLVLASTLAVVAVAAVEPSIPPPRGWLTDTAGVVGPVIAKRVTAICEELARATGTEIAILTVETTAPLDDFTYALKVADAWRPSRKGVDRGLVFLVATKDRKLRILTGYGLEATLPDGLVGEISDAEILPAFRAGHIDEGILRGVEALAARIAAANGITLTGVPPPSPGARAPSPIIFVLAVLLAMILLYALSPPRRRRWYAGPAYVPGFGGGGGGFGGFGGSGGFGGGGAGRSW